MATDVTTTIVPGHGTVFIAPANTACPSTPMSSFGLATTPSGWENLGHTSKDNLPTFKKDGGDPTFLDSWLQDSIDVIYATANWSLGINPIQVDQNTLAMAYNGSLDTDAGYIIPASNYGLKKALFLLMTDGTGQLGFYIPNVQVTVADAPSIDTTKFFETPLTASILAASNSVIPAVNGIAGLMKLYKTGLGTATPPTITTALPASKTAGDWVELVGTGFTGVTGVTVGGSSATWVYGSDGGILVKIPTLTAGSNPIIVTTSAGSSTAKAYTTT